MKSSLLLWLWYYLWIAPHVLLIPLAFLMVRGRSYSQFPMFFAYTCFEIIEFTSLFIAGHIASAYPKYLIIFAVGAILASIIRFGIIYEIIAHLLRNYRSLDALGKNLLRWAALALLLVAVGFSVWKTGSGLNRLMLGVSIVDRTFSVVQSGLLICLFLFARYFSLSWRSKVFGIALGFGIFASVELASSALRSQVGISTNHFLDYLTMGTYHLCVLIWLFYFMASERPTKYNSPDPPENDLEDWKDELEKLIRK
jgi:hypothetical protein